MNVRISRINVFGLFDRFNHYLPLDPAEHVTIMIGPNGYGKTMILRILNALFNLPIRSLERIPFRKLEVVFDDGSALVVDRALSGTLLRRRGNQYQLELKYSPPRGRTQHFEPRDAIKEEDLNFPVAMIDDVIPALDQIGPSEWLQTGTGEVLDLTDVLLEYGDQLPIHPELTNVTPDWLVTIKDAIPVRFVGTERLTQSSVSEPRTPRAQRRHMRTSAERTVKQYSDNLSERVRQTLGEYATLSQSLDRTFPTRVVDEPHSPAPSLDELTNQLRKVEDRRSNLAEAGLLVQQEETPLPDINALDESRRGVLSVYAKDALTKLGVFDDLYARVNTFKRIANARFLYKQVSVGTGGLTVKTQDGPEIDLEMLSSGEQHELVLLYDLLFGTKENSLIMIDEPELSLHVAWQAEILSDLQEMAHLSDFHALLATHSPQIIGDRWDLAVELKGPYGE